MHTPEFVIIGPVPEQAPSATDILILLQDEIRPGFNDLNGNEELESLYLDYQAAILDEQYADAPNYRRFDQLPEYEQEQAWSMVSQLTQEGLASATILGKRLRRIRILEVEHHSAVGNGDVGGEFDNGLAVVATGTGSQLCTPQQRNHVMLHEIAHGLATTNSLVLIGSTIASSGTGLVDQSKASTEAFFTMAAATEAVVDSLALSVSDLDTRSYLAGRMPGIGYYSEVAALASFTVARPDLSRQLWRATFADGPRSRTETETLAEAYEPYLIVDDSLTTTPQLLPSIVLRPA